MKNLWVENTTPEQYVVLSADDHPKYCDTLAEAERYIEAQKAKDEQAWIKDQGPFGPYMPWYGVARVERVIEMSYDEYKKRTR
jgi:hypothetical protein